MTTEDLARRKQELLWIQHEQGTFVRREKRYCRHDKDYVLAVGPARWWGRVLPAIALLGFVAVILVVFVDPFGIFALIAAGLLIAVLGPFIALARRPLRCPRCRREVPYHTKEEADEADRQDAARRAAMGIERPSASSPT
ncbi:hypothetical protein [Sandaracinus amylolyticus]|uniref:hypothetical protein n=1 Tax=Sandaracinus amylolyticus TaxID=927083 RepID=UPI001F2EFA65|nr:hypothetical protein [Sandaracinus amylolyticus]UJR84160.1 Hypothetical protein I5071_62310 [Sandaracinus amylolyticus]